MFNPANAKALVRLIARTIPYDPSLDFQRANMQAFKRLYRKPNSLLKSTIDQMQSSGEIGTQERRDILETFGVIPSTVH